MSPRVYQDETLFERLQPIVHFSPADDESHRWHVAKLDDDIDRTPAAAA
jgi:hypothetical protein